MSGTATATAKPAGHTISAAFPRIINGGIGDAWMAFEDAFGFERSQFALQINPHVSRWIRGLGLEMSLDETTYPVDQELGDEPAGVYELAKQNAAFVLERFKAEHGFFPTFLFLDNDRFYSEPSWWVWLDNDVRLKRASRASRLLRTDQSHFQMAYLAATWLDRCVRAVLHAIAELGADTKVASWATVDAKRVRSVIPFVGKNAATIDTAVAEADFIMANCYVEGWSKDLSEADLYRRSRDATLAARLIAGDRPVYVTSRLRIFPGTDPVSPAQMDAVCGGAADAGAHGFFLWERGFPHVGGGASVDTGQELLKVVRQHFKD